MALQRNYVFAVIAVVCFAAQGLTQSSSPLNALLSSMTSQTQEQWVATYGGGNSESVTDSAQAKGGGFFVCGQTFATDADAWVVRINDLGNVRWEISLGGDGRDQVQAVLATEDRGCLLAGSTNSFGAGGTDGWIVKLDARGSVQWQQTYGGLEDELFATMDVSPNGYYVGGTIDSQSTGLDAWILEIGNDGSILWQETLVGEFDDRVRSLAATDDGLVFTADSRSSFIPLEPVPEIPFFRPWLVRLDGNGNVRWQKTFNFSGGDAWNHLVALPDGGFIVTGEILAMGFYRGDVWLAKIDKHGNLVWNRAYGDNSGVNFVDSGAQVQPRSDGGFTVAGSTGTGGAGSEDVWLVRVDREGNLLSSRAFGGIGFENGAGLTSFEKGFLVVGTAGSFGSSPDAFVLHLPERALSSVLCNVITPTAPNVWTPVIMIGSPNPGPVPTFVVPAVSGATRTVLVDAVQYICPPS